jgi:hypothetical protein
VELTKATGEEGVEDIAASDQIGRRGSRVVRRVGWGRRRQGLGVCRGDRFGDSGGVGRIGDNRWGRVEGTVSPLSWGRFGVGNGAKPTESGIEVEAEFYPCPLRTHKRKLSAGPGSIPCRACFAFGVRSAQSGQEQRGTVSTFSGLLSQCRITSLSEASCKYWVGVLCE